MKYTVLTLFPEITDAYFATSIMAKAIQRGIIEYRAVNIRDFALDKHKTCDDAPYGGGPGMLMLPEPLGRALESAGVREKNAADWGVGADSETGCTGGGADNTGDSKELQPGTSPPFHNKRVIYLSPSGRPFNQALAQELAQEQELVLLCGRYEGIDQRVIDRYIDDEVSVGDYVLSSGEIATLALIDATYRLVDRVITPESLDEESFSGGLLEYPQYTRPEIFDTMKVPDVLLSGHHENIRRWRLEKRIEKTLRCRPDLIRRGGELGLFNEEINGIIDRMIGDSEHERD
ncbi:MAG: tRNA (guanosine(37)-N1)-methyltransferase TrmD [Treponema sp.]|jgi:tRNA (guanine37-N1)-methyltransferase|nr:tRNA (guanosine(37)-N1)-methyltransferase TrmD [Treponema sp.]